MKPGPSKHGALCDCTASTHKSNPAPGKAGPSAHPVSLLDRRVFEILAGRRVWADIRPLCSHVLHGPRGQCLLSRPDLPPRETEAAGRPGVSPSHAVPPILDSQGRARGGDPVQGSPSGPQCASPVLWVGGGWQRVPAWRSGPHRVILPEGREGTLGVALPAPGQASMQPRLMALFFVSDAQQLAQPPPGRVTAPGLFSPRSQGDGGGLGPGMTWEFCLTLAVAAGPSGPAQELETTPPLAGQCQARGRVGRTGTRKQPPLCPRGPLRPQLEHDTPFCCHRLGPRSRPATSFRVGNAHSPVRST